MRVAEIRELQGRDTFVVKNIGLCPVVGVESGGVFLWWGWPGLGC